MTSTQPANFNQPQSLVKYSNPVLVSSSGKKQLKVIQFWFRTIKQIPMQETHTLKTFLTRFCHQDNTQQKSSNYGFNQYLLLLRLNRTFLICNKSLTKGYSKDRQDKQVSVPSGNNCIRNVLMSSLGKLLSTALREAFF